MAAGGDVEDALDQLYAVAPEQFTARRTELAAAAKKRGDTAAAKQIGAARKPTVSASVVNRLIHSDHAAIARIADVGERLRAAHTEMDGEQIRQLSAEQRKLVATLTRAAFAAADIADPSAALRDDVTDTLQAAIADPDVTARLGRLVRAEQWSGFGGFGDSAAVLSRPAPKKKVSAPAKKTPERETPKPETPKPDDSARRKARAVLAAAERAKADADDVTAQRQSDLATARLRRDDARDRLAKAEQALHAAEAAYEEAKNAGRQAADVVRAARGAVT